MNFKKIATSISVLLFLVYLVWWIWLEIYVPPEGSVRDSYSISYGIIAGFGGVIGLIIAKKWDGFKSYVGKSLIFFSVGLLCQFLGQNSYSIQYFIDHVENSYPSYGEIFFVISIPSYILGVIYIAKASGWEYSFKNLQYKIVAILFPLTMVTISYYMFINGTDYASQSLLANVLTFFYPVGQAVFVSLAIIAYIMSGKVLGGVMKPRVAFILFSLVVQYIADSLFFYKTIQGTWYHADESEFLFAFSYAIMTFAFLQFLTVFDSLKKEIKP